MMRGPLLPPLCASNAPDIASNATGMVNISAPDIHHPCCKTLDSGIPFYGHGTSLTH